ncbi:Uu.00g107670.m01.CDS01 [Anthostomella pinea]|uniref:Uu.00g107670.m01.CDS01 n=1 Tax=Anthostomella pinea TaxID=933095 RepID=A0AAI8YFX3_9PEZI|nr:Uu.00g107670.m01.CDS01 [Anthostomella pinea]
MKFLQVAIPLVTFFALPTLAAPQQVAKADKREQPGAVLDCVKDKCGETSDPGYFQCLADCLKAHG